MENYHDNISSHEKNYKTTFANRFTFKPLCIFMGPRKTGKSFWINKHYQGVPLIDLLKTDVFADYISRPSLLREQFQTYKGLIIIDEIQMVPDLLNEIHWLIENAGISFFNDRLQRTKIAKRSCQSSGWKSLAFFNDASNIF
jgi:predicted AAA+ superfamily ATPase